jgi:hypothetical protein
MKFSEIADMHNTPLIEAKLVWARKGKKITRKFRCTFGKRAGRVVSNPNQCNAAIDLQKRFVLNRTKAQKGSRMMRKSKNTKKMNPASRMVRALNR